MISIFKTRFNHSINKFRLILLALLSITTIISWNLISAPAISENAVKQNLTPQQLGKIINKTEKSWEYDYEEYFQQDFTNYSQTEKQISQQLTKLSKATGSNSGVMWAVPTPQQLYLLLITPGSDPIIKSVKSARGEALAEVVDNFNQNIRSSLKYNSKSYLPSAKLLHKWLIEPIEPELKAANIDTLMLCSGSGLRTFPFAALYDGEQFLIEKYSLVRLPGLNLTNISYEPDENDELNVLAMGASEFIDLPPLPGVEVEVPTITPKILPGKAMLNQDFTVKNLQA
jgi:CHAT domain-containing protein